MTEPSGMQHWTEPRRGKLRVVIELDLPDALGHLGTEHTRYKLERRLEDYLTFVRRDILEVLQILDHEGETGTVKWFDDAKGFGFIRGYDHKDIFVHKRQLDGRELKQGQVVRFKRRHSRENFEAIDVQLEDGPSS